MATHERDDGVDGRRNRLPSFTEVLSRRTKPPVDLFMFYLFLQREGAEDILDFWLDVQQHENLCRAYFKDIRKSGRTIRDDWPEFWDYARKRGSIYGQVVGMSTGPTDMRTKRSTASTGELLEPEKRERDGRVQSPDFGPEHDPPRSTTPFSFGRNTPTLFGRRASRAPTVIPRNAAVAKQDLVRSAEYIFFRYLAPGGGLQAGEDSHEIYLPPALRVHTFPLSGAHEPRTASEMGVLAQVPDMFHAQKEYVFRAMEQDAFPRFLRAKAFGNLTPVSALARLVAGLVCLWIALAAAFSLVFLDLQPKSLRFWLFLPFFFAFLFLVAHQYELDPLLVFLNRSESTPFRTLAIREPYVRKLLLGRALWVALLVAIFTVALTLIFWAVPGHRL